jgi:hypothetical protein
MSTEQKLLKKIAFTLLLICAITSLILVINAGRNNSSILLQALFIIWVFSPFVVILFVNKLSKVWKAKIQFWFYWVTIFLTGISIIAYSGILTPQNTKPAFIFLVFPFLSWLLILIFILVAKKLSRNVNT